MQSYHKLRQALDKLGRGTVSTLTEDQLNTVATILSYHKSDDRRIGKLREAGIAEEIIPFLLPLSFRGNGHLSIKTMRKLIPLMEQGMRYDEACTQVYGDLRGDHTGERKSGLTLNDMENEITDPVVRRAVSRTIKVVNAVVRTCGAPDVVRTELAREMSRSFEERNKIKRRQEDQSKNEKAREQIAGYKGDRAAGLDIVKFKLFKDQDGVCLYSGKNLDISRLFEADYAAVDNRKLRLQGS